MTAQPTSSSRPATQAAGAFQVVSLHHPQGCRGYLIVEPTSKEALAVDVHLDLVHEVSERIRDDGLTLRFVVDTHTHADHPSGAGAIAEPFGAVRVAHIEGHHSGVQLHPEDGQRLELGQRHVTVRHAPGHTPDHIVLLTERELFAGDTLLIGGVARTDFLGGDADALHDTLHWILDDLDEDTVVYPGHDYEGRGHSTIGAERARNPWLSMEREEFVRQLTANPPPRPANMDDLLRLNRAGVDIPETMTAAEAVKHLAAGGATSVIDVRTGVEYEGEHIPGSRLMPLDQLKGRLDEVRATPAPRLLLCRTGSRAEMARKMLLELNVGGLTVVEGGIEAYVRAGGETEIGRAVMSLERQVRTSAGALVVLGTLLGALVHPLFLLIPGFVGAGLVFAGVTDWCGMGLVLAKAPWNRSSAADAGGGCAASAPSACSASAPSACAASAPTGRR